MEFLTKSRKYTFDTNLDINSFWVFLRVSLTCFLISFLASLLYQQLSQNIQGLNELIGIFIERYKTNQFLSKSLNTLSESKNNITTFDSLLEGILGFKGDMFNQYNYLSEFLVGLRDEIIKPLSANYKTFSEKLNKNYSETLAIHKAYQSSVNQLEISKNHFHSSVYAAEQCKLKSEYYKKRIKKIR